jgi:hypothetical protein
MSHLGLARLFCGESKLESFIRDIEGDSGDEF